MGNCSEHSYRNTDLFRGKRKINMDSNNVSLQYKMFVIWLFITVFEEYIVNWHANNNWKSSEYLFILRNKPESSCRESANWNVI